MSFELLDILYGAFIALLHAKAESGLIVFIGLLASFSPTTTWRRYTRRGDNMRMRARAGSVLDGNGV